MARAVVDDTSSAVLLIYTSHCKPRLTSYLLVFQASITYVYRSFSECFCIVRFSHGELSHQAIPLRAIPASIHHHGPGIKMSDLQYMPYISDGFVTTQFILQM